jgi:hypothetical protein
MKSLSMYYLTYSNNNYFFFRKSLDAIVIQKIQVLGGVLAAEITGLQIFSRGVVLGLGKA